MVNSSDICKEDLADHISRRDWFPLVRLLTVAAVILLGLHLIPSWHDAVGNIWVLPGRILEGFIAIALLSFVLAQVYLLILMVPVVGAVLLNDWIFGASEWLLRTVFRLRPGYTLGFLSLTCEVSVFLILVDRFIWFNASL